MSTPYNPKENISTSHGLLLQKDQTYRLVPFDCSFEWQCGVFSSSIFDKAYQISMQGFNSMRIAVSLNFDLSEEEAEKTIRALKNNQVNTVMTPCSYIDPSGILKEMMVYPDNISITNAENGRIKLQLNMVTDTASPIVKWKTSFFANAVVYDNATTGVTKLDRFDIVRNDKIFYYILEDVSASTLQSQYGGDIIVAAKAVGKKHEFPMLLSSPFNKDISPDYFLNDFSESYPVRAWKGEQTYDYTGVTVSRESVQKKELLCTLHFLEHQYGYKNFHIPQIDDKWYNTQQWSHSWLTGDYHSFSMSINQSHAIKNYK